MFDIRVRVVHGGIELVFSGIAVCCLAAATAFDRIVGPLTTVPRLPFGILAVIVIVLCSWLHGIASLMVLPLAMGVSVLLSMVIICGGVGRMEMPDGAAVIWLWLWVGKTLIVL